MNSPSPLFSWRRCREDLLLEHESGEFSAFFSSGTRGCIPHLIEVDARWAFPWRSAFLTITLIFLSMLILFVEHYSRMELENVKIFLGLIMIGSIATPIGLLTGIVEMNLKRDISWMLILWLVVIGGIGSILFALMTPFWGIIDSSAVAGPIEELAKLAVVLILIRRKQRDGQILHGLIYGAAAACGFSIFESLGYAFEELVQCIHEEDGGLLYSEAIVVMSMRSIFNFFGGHISYTALSCGALWMGMREGKGLKHALTRPLFIFMFSLAMCLHSLWNLSLEFEWHLITLIFPIMAWIPTLWLIHRGIKQVRQEQDAWKELHAQSAAIFWLKPQKMDIQGPYTLQQMQTRFSQGLIGDEDSYLIGEDVLHQSPISRLSAQLPAPLPDERSEDNWLQAKNGAWMHFLHFFGGISALGLVASVVDMGFILIYLCAIFIIFLMIWARLISLWKRIPQPSNARDEYGTIKPIPVGPSLWLKCFIPIYNLYWFRLLTLRLIRFYNITVEGRNRIPIWIPRLYWWTCALSCACFCILLHEESSIVFYTVFLIFFYSIAAYFMALAMRCVKRRNPYLKKP